MHPWLQDLCDGEVGPTSSSKGAGSEASRLGTHLRRFVARNTFDYFIHKDLGSFLRQELDVYIKNEIVLLDDLVGLSQARGEQYLSKARVVRAIAHKIIDLLAQLEDFQKKLWLKKKFVVECRYCIPLRDIPSDFYPEILANEGQRAEWTQLLSPPAGVRVDASSFDADFLVEHPSLVIDTAHFNEGFVGRLLGTFSDINAATDGLLIHSENFQALSLLQGRYRDNIQCVYIDPPYNTGQDGFAYKDSYKSSSWATMMNDRLALSRQLLGQRGALFSSINEIERTNLELVLKQVFGAENRVEEIIWARDTMSNNSPTYSTNHEYVQVFARSRPVVEADRRMFRESKPGFEEVMALVDSFEGQFPELDAVESQLRELYKSHREEHLSAAVDRGEVKAEAVKSDPWKGLYPYRHAEYRDDLGTYVPPELARERKARLWIWRQVEPSMPAGKQSPTTKDPQSENFRYYKPKHPDLGVEVPGPKRGWAFPFKSSPGRPSFESYNQDHRIMFKADATSIPQLKYFLHEVDSIVSSSVLRQYADGEPRLEALFGRKGLIDNPKPPDLIEKFVRQTTQFEDVVLDFFAGSGTSAQAVISANRRDGLRRKFVLVEMGDYFESVLVPRYKKVAYAAEWNAGSPTQVAEGSDLERSPGIVKVLRLESYDDTLASLELNRSAVQTELITSESAQGADGLKEQYILQYQLDVESRGSSSLLNATAFTDPRNYGLRVKSPHGHESRTEAVDLHETFNWLLGLATTRMTPWVSYDVRFDRDTEERLQLADNLVVSDNGHWAFRATHGRTPVGLKALVIWRTLTGDLEQDNLVLNEWFKQEFGPAVGELDLIYVNGDCTLGATGLTWDGAAPEVRSIDGDFHRLMFEGAHG